MLLDNKIGQPQDKLSSMTNPKFSPKVGKTNKSYLEKIICASLKSNLPQ